MASAQGNSAQGNSVQGRSAFPRPGLVARSARVAHADDGFSMTEILVTLLVLAFGLLALAGMQMHTLRFLNNTAQQSSAMQMAQELSERMRANPRGVQNGAYLFDGLYADKAGTSPDPAIDCQQKKCSSIEIAVNDLAELQSQAASKFYAGALHIEADQDLWRISVLWREVGFTERDPVCPASANVTNGVRCFNLLVSL